MIFASLFVLFSHLSAQGEMVRSAAVPVSERNTAVKLTILKAGVIMPSDFREALTSTAGKVSPDSAGLRGDASPQGRRVHELFSLSIPLAQACWCVGTSLIFCFFKNKEGTL